MTADLKDLFDQAGRNPPARALDADAVLQRGRRFRNRRITGAVAAVVVVTLALGVGLASQRRLSAAPLPTAPTLGSLGRLAYGAHGDIYVTDSHGRNRVRIANGVPADGGPACRNYWNPFWSPDGRYLAYRGGGHSGSCQETVNISDPGGHRVASFPGSGWLISWSPDSTRVATWVRFGHTIGIYGLDGVRQALLTVPPGVMEPGDFDPVWSPDGASLMVPGGVEIPVDGSAPRVLPADDPRSRDSAHYSPDGSRVAWLHYGFPGGYTRITASLVVAGADGSQARVLIQAGVQGFVWSPTGDRIAFESVTDGGRTSELRMVDVASGTVTSLADGGGADALGVIEFSPEGDQILFSRTGAKGVTSLWSVQADGSDPHQLVAGSGSGDWQSLSPAR